VLAWSKHVEGASKRLSGVDPLPSAHQRSTPPAVQVGNHVETVAAPGNLNRPFETRRRLARGQ
jgi:hypothetical protein